MVGVTSWSIESAQKKEGTVTVCMTSFLAQYFTY